MTQISSQPACDLPLFTAASKRLSSRLILSMIVGLSGCTTIPEDFGRSEVDTLVSDRGLNPAIDVSGTSTLLHTLTSEPITATSAMQIALLNNPSLTGIYARLGISSAELYRAGRISNPIISYSSLDTGLSGEHNLRTLGLITSLTDLITMPSRMRLAQAEFHQTQQSVAAAVLSMAAHAQSAFHHYTAARQTAMLSQRLARAAGLSYRIAERYYKAGNLNDRELAIERANASRMRLEALEAEAAAYGLRRELALLLGLPLDGNWSVKGPIGLPLDIEDELDTLKTMARQSRLDYLAATASVESLADQRGVSGWQRWIQDFDIGYEHETETDGTTLEGPVFEWRLPLFSQHRDVLMTLDAELQMAIAELAILQQEIDSAVLLAHAGVQNARQRVSEYRTQLIPARITAVSEAQAQEGYMLIGVFELIEVKLQEYEAYQGYLMALRDYWLARTDLFKAVGNSLPSSNQEMTYLDLDALLASPAGEQGHHGSHSGMNHEEDGHDMESMDHSRHDKGTESEGSETDHDGHLHIGEQS